MTFWRRSRLLKLSLILLTLPGAALMDENDKLAPGGRAWWRVFAECAGLALAARDAAQEDVVATYQQAMREYIALARERLLKDRHLDERPADKLVLPLAANRWEAIRKEAPAQGTLVWYGQHLASCTEARQDYEKGSP